VIDSIVARPLQRLTSHQTTFALAHDSCPSAPTSGHHGRPFGITSVATEQSAPALVITIRRPRWPAWRIWERQVRFRRWRGGGAGAATVTVTTTTIREVIANYGPDGSELTQHHNVLGQPVSAATATTTGTDNTNTTALEAAWARVAHGPHRIPVCPPAGFLQ
jgi:hypothetical protein